MCLIVFAWQQAANMPLLLAANRDEFYARPAAPAQRWEDQPGILAGRDLEAGGTWLGVNDRGAFAAITNIRDPRATPGGGARSRGELPVEFLAGSQSPESYLRQVARRLDDYQGFNLLLGDGQSLWYLHGSAGASTGPRALSPGVYGLSNAALDVPWPKVQLGRERLRDLLSKPGAPTHGELGACLDDRRLAAPETLRDQQLEGEMARMLSAQFIVTPHYGTRCRTTLRQRVGQLDFQEQRFDDRGDLIGTAAFELPPGRGA